MALLRRVIGYLHFSAWCENRFVIKSTKRPRKENLTNWPFFPFTTRFCKKANSFYEWMAISTKGNGNVHFFGVLVFFSSHISWWDGISFYILLRWCPYVSRIFPIIFQTSLKPITNISTNNNKKEQHFICLWWLESWLLIQFFHYRQKKVDLIWLEFLAILKVSFVRNLPLSVHPPPLFKGM